ncbi:cytochrome c [Methylotenera sp.]|uniref:c-type cytochrome n=1 Tax=Methylotenera sp. TaxID=2051956 RepID=UPI0024898A6E|nr:cytochrome c [Methylotenera sp.]MDI1298210.1 cytochrome c [Methylotenera sp.]
MKSLSLSSLILSFGLALCSLASAEPFTSADANAGKALVAKNCVSCHAESFGGDGSGIYTRESRKVKTSKGLVAQVRSCNTMIGLKWFEDEELNVAKYLNQTYYKFTE